MARRAQHLRCSLCERSERGDNKLDKVKPACLTLSDPLIRGESWEGARGVQKRTKASKTAFRSHCARPTERDMCERGVRASCPNFREPRAHARLTGLTSHRFADVRRPCQTFLACCCEAYNCARAAQDLDGHLAHCVASLSHVVTHCELRGRAPRRAAA